MLECFSFNSSTSSSTSTTPGAQHSPHSQGDTCSPSISREYNLTVQANSYTEILSKIQNPSPLGPMHLLLNPDRDCVQKALSINTKNKSSTLTRLISTFLDHSQTASELCLRLHVRLHRARAMYSPLLHHLTVSHPFDSILLRDRAFQLFLDFDNHENPFPNSQDFTNIRSSLTDLKQQIDSSLRKSRSRIRLFRCATAGSAVCFVATAFGVVAAAVAVSFHAIVALAAVCSTNIPRPEKREISRFSQFDAAAKGAYVLNNDLDTVDRLVARLHTAVEGDRLLIRLGLEKGRERCPIQDLLLLLWKNREIFLHQLEDLEEHICLCIYTVNKTRLLLLQEICKNHQSL